MPLAPRLDVTHDPRLESWIESANDPATDFPVQNLPFCAFRHPDGTAHSGVRVGDVVIDLRALMHHPLFLKPFVDEITENEKTLARFIHYSKSNDPNEFMALGNLSRHNLRQRLSELLRADSGALRDDREWREGSIFGVDQVEMLLPCAVRNYTDFYASIDHARTVGSMFRPEQPLLPNYKHVPIGYHGRASSVVPSGGVIRRPRGQRTPTAEGGEPGFGPCTMLDYELEVGCLIGPGNELGRAIAIGEAREHIFGLCLVNDWSARDIQRWEYQPLGPFLAKNFATSASPYVVTLDALEPFRVAGSPRGAGDPEPLAYLRDEEDRALGGFDIVLEVSIQSAAMRTRGQKPMVVSRGRAFRDMYWTFAQMVAHHTVNGCNLEAGDLLASGTVSGKERETRGCLLEMTWEGVDESGKARPRRPIELPSGETRTFLEDGDTVVMRGWCEREGFRRIGFGSCVGTVVGSDWKPGDGVGVGA